MSTITGTAGDDSLVGTTTADSITGLAGSDTIDGGTGVDTMVGGLGNDLYFVDVSTDVVTESSAEGTDEVRAASASYTLGANIENLTYTGAATFSGVGNALANVLTGGAGGDTLTGGAGADTLSGGGGIDIAGYSTAGAAVTASLANPGVNTGDAAGDTYSGIEGLLGSNYADTLTGDAGANSLSGGSGNDLIQGGAGADTIDGGAGADTASYASAASAVSINLTSGTHTGEAAGDTFTAIEVWGGTAFADTLTSSTTINSTFQGGAGDDLYVVDSTADIVVENAAEGTDTVQTTSASYTLGLNVENLTYTGAATFTGTGNALANVLTGGAGADTLIGGAGADTLSGGGGIDIAGYSTAGAAVTASLANPGVNIGDAAGDTYSGIEGLLGSNYADTLIGDAGANSLNGGSGNDLIQGGAGSDTIDGGAGTDTASYTSATSAVSINLTSGTHTGEAAGDTFTAIEVWTGTSFADTLTSSTTINSTFQGGAGDDLYVVDSTADVVVENAAEGTDTVQTTSASYILGANVENLTYISTGGFSGTGNALANALTGGAGNETLIGGAGADTLSGGGGIDIAGYSTAGAAMTASLANPGVNTGDAAGDTYSGIEGLLGSSYADTLTGDGGGNSLSGGSGNDLIQGGAGADTIDGGAGTDTASYASAASAVSINLTSGTHTGDAAGDTFTSIEIWTGTAFADSMTSATTISSNFQGGAGDDLYVVDSTADVVVENAAEGTDTVQTTSASYILSANVENLTYISTGGFSGTGNALANLLTGGAGNDTLIGGAGADTLSGAAGIDFAGYSTATAGVSASLANPAANTGDAAGDSYSGIEGLIGSGYDDTLTGDAGANSLSGGSGNDLIQGGVGADTIDGGAGTSDIASYSSAAAAVTINLTSGTHTGDAAGDIFTGIEIWRGTAFADTMTSSTTIGSNFQGGAGDDLYVVDSAADVVVENVGEGADTVQTTSASYTLGANVEGLTYTGAAAFSGVGSAVANVLNGGSGNDTLDGAGGADTLNGGAGVDVASYTSATSGVSLNFATGMHTGNAAGDVFNSIEIFKGSNYGDTLTGDSAGNNLQGGNGSDIVEGGAGADTLDGGAGTDVASYIHAASGISLNLATGVHTGEAAGDVLTTFEVFAGSSFADTLTGSTAAETFMGGGGADQIVGGGGSDMVSYATSAAGVTVNLATSTATGGDATGDTFTGIASIHGSAYADVLTGNASANLIIGAGGNDTIDGGDGDDIIQLYTDSSDPYNTGFPADIASVNGGAGDDQLLETTEDRGSTLHGDAGDDYFQVWAGNVFGDDGNDTFNLLGGSPTPGAGATLDGGAGNDIFQLKGGGNIIYGGAGADTYEAVNMGYFNQIYDSSAGQLDIVKIDDAATTSDLYIGVDTANDNLYITTQDDVADGTVDTGIVIRQYSTTSIHRVYAADGNFISV